MPEPQVPERDFGSSQTDRMFDNARRGMAAGNRSETVYTERAEDPAAVEARQSFESITKWVDRTAQKVYDEQFPNAGEFHYSTFADNRAQMNRAREFMRQNVLVQAHIAFPRVSEAGKQAIQILEKAKKSQDWLAVAGKMRENVELTPDELQIYDGITTVEHALTQGVKDPLPSLQQRFTDGLLAKRPEYTQPTVEEAATPEELALQNLELWLDEVKGRDRQPIKYPEDVNQITTRMAGEYQAAVGKRYDEDFMGRQYMRGRLQGTLNSPGWQTVMSMLDNGYAIDSENLQLIDGVEALARKMAPEVWRDATPDQLADKLRETRAYLNKPAEQPPSPDKGNRRRF